VGEWGGEEEEEGRASRLVRSTSPEEEEDEGEESKLRRATPKPKTTSVSARFTLVDTLVDNGKANFGESMVAEAQQLKTGDKRKRKQVDRGPLTYN
jgi:hypothetical protein